MSWLKRSTEDGKECCCVKGHSVYFILNNLTDFTKGYPPYNSVSVSYVPSLKMEGQCSRCNAVIRTNYNLHRGADAERNAGYIIQQLMIEIGRLAEENSCLKAEKSTEPEKRSKK